MHAFACFCFCMLGNQTPRWLECCFGNDVVSTKLTAMNPTFVEWNVTVKRRLDRGSFKQLWFEIALVHRSESKAGPIWMESSNWNTIKVQHIQMLRCQAARRHRLTARNIFGRLPFTNPKLLRWSSILWKANHSEETSKFTLRISAPFCTGIPYPFSLGCLNLTAARMPAPRSECKI